MISDIFDPNADQKNYEFWMRVKKPSKTYAILFTPRSGSSWLTSILTKTKAMGTPAEWFNPSLMPSNSKAKESRNLDQFISAISRHETHGDIFGFEITYHQLCAVFGTEKHFMEYFLDAEFFWLIREDIVAQGVSLDKMVQTKVGHAANSDLNEIKKSDSAYDYDGKRILKWIQHIRTAEVGTEKLLAKYDLKPTRLSYENNSSVGVERVVDTFATKLELQDFAPENFVSEHRKIGTIKNVSFADRFRAEYAEFIKRVNVERADMLSHFKK